MCVMHRMCICNVYFVDTCNVCDVYCICDACMCVMNIYCIMYTLMYVKYVIYTCMIKYSVIHTMYTYVKYIL